MNLEEYLSRMKRLVDEALDRFLPPASAEPSIIHEAMRYSALDGGKRIRPILTLAAAETVGGSIEDALPAACAIEMIHAFSLIHDDLPCMDDDDLRRGKPTSHKKFGEAIALLAGDALFATAFETIARTPPTVPREVVARVTAIIAAASGTGGMVGGQVLDLLAEGKQLDVEQVRLIHTRKTGALIRAAAVAGAELGRGKRAEIEAISEYGSHLGLAFQIVDDILDIEGEEAILGKKPGADARLEKATYPSVVGLQESKRLAAEEISRAVQAVSALGERGRRLSEIASYILERET